jgi:uncharacterized protein YgiM (DUF1202 family)
MYVKLCPQCGYQLARKAKRCDWCKSPVKKKTPFLIYILVLLIFLILVTRFRRNDNAITSLPSQPTQPQAVKVVKTEPLIKKSKGDSSTIYVRAQAVNLRKGPALTSHTIKKLKKGQRLTQVSRSGDWLQVLADDAGNGPAWVHSSLVENNKPLPKPTQPQVVKVIKTDPLIKKSKGGFSTIYVRAQVANIRKNPSLTSHTIKKLKKGQRLTQVGRSGDWLQVLADDAGNGPAWVHSSLVGKTLPSSSTKAPSEQKAFKMFRISFDQFNAEIKKLKGMTFFNDVEYLNQGVIQVTATDILLSAPKRYKEKYLITLMGMWLDVRETNQPATVRIVDKDGHLQLEEKQS